MMGPFAFMILPGYGLSQMVLFKGEMHEKSEHKRCLVLLRAIRNNAIGKLTDCLAKAGRQRIL
jgi:hypothetical protein